MQGMLAQVEGWAAEFERLCERIGPRFARPEVRRRVVGFLQGLLGNAGTQERLAAGRAAPARRTPDGMQRLLTTARWDADAVRDDLRAYVVEHLGDPGGVLVVDETGFLKKGTKSAGVQRQYSGTAGRIENCQVGVFLAYASAKGRALLDRELYLPEEWAADPTARGRGARGRRRSAFATKPQLARRMLERALDAGVPAGWVTGDEVYGGDGRLRPGWNAADWPYVLAVKATQPLWAATAQGPAEVQARTLVAGLPSTGVAAAERRGWRQGPAGLRLGRVALVRPGWAGRGLLAAGPAPPDRPASWPTTPAPGRRARRWASWCGSPARAGRSRSASRPARARSAWTTTRSAARTPGIGTSPWRWWRRRSWRWSARACSTRRPCPPGVSARGAAERAELPGPPGSDLCWLSMAEVRRLLLGLVWWTPPGVRQVLWWSRWRRRHQARARHYHWRRRLQVAAVSA